MGDRKQFSLAENTLATRQKTLKLIERRFELGMGNELDRAHARSAIEAARASQARYLRLVEQDINALQMLAGMSITKAGLR
ncbi:TolC family protein [Ferribacterium limneticum]|uniref:TolC family protein n=1 Tax=Ferribacterium limneticum TaxID=76259 RepID=UPI001CFB63D4|nr:TolC family protein [Ferribacterium limneticum]UCV17826.1 TolC family protein [Ferribacterium limneticum]